MASYKELRRRIESLEKKAAEARRAEAATVIAGIRQQIAEFELTPADLFGTAVGTRKPRTSPRAAIPKAAISKAAVPKAAAPIAAVPTAVTEPTAAQAGGPGMRSNARKSARRPAASARGQATATPADVPSPPRPALRPATEWPGA